MFIISINIHYINYKKLINVNYNGFAKEFSRSVNIFQGQKGFQENIFENLGLLYGVVLGKFFKLMR